MGSKLGGKRRAEHFAPHRNRIFETTHDVLGIEERPCLLSPDFSGETVTVLHPSKKSISPLNVIQKPNSASSDSDKTLVSKTLVFNRGLLTAPHRRVPFTRCVKFTCPHIIHIFFSQSLLVPGAVIQEIARSSGCFTKKLKKDLGWERLSIVQHY